MGFKIKDLSGFAPVALSGLGGAIGGPVGGVLGGALGSSWATSVANEQERAYQAEQFQKNADLQREFAKSSITWKIDDAAQRGISPLAALGAQGYSASPATVGASGLDFTGGMASMGQNLSRMIEAGQNEDQRVTNRLQQDSLRADIKGKDLDNEMRAIELRKATNPPIPTGKDNKHIPGQADGPSNTKVHQLREYYKSPQGGYGALLSSNVKQAVEDTPREFAIDVRDMAHQQINPHSRRFIGRLPKNRKGQRWSFNYPTQEYIEVPENASIWERMGRHSSYMWR